MINKTIKKTIKKTHKEAVKTKDILQVPIFIQIVSTKNWKY